MKKIKNVLVRVFKICLIIVLLPLIILWIIFRKRNKNSKQDELIDVYNISQIDSLSGEEFELLLKEIFEKQGYQVSLTKKSHDFGADLILKHKNNCSVVQAKCYDKNIGIKAIQEIISAKKHYGADEMFVASNRYFSKEAIILATEHGVKLIDRDVMIKLVRQFLPKIELQGKKYCATIDEERQKIESKYRFWI